MAANVSQRRPPAHRRPSRQALTCCRGGGVPWHCSNTCSIRAPAEDDSTRPPPGPTRSRPIHRTTAKEQTVRPYDDLVEVRKAPAGGCEKPGLGSDLGPDLGTDLGPDQFLWRGRLWQVREVIAHWVESGAWWVARPEEAPHGSQLAREREVWRVAAARG